jgi:hypothetical protein
MPNVLAAFACKVIVTRCLWANHASKIIIVRAAHVLCSNASSHESMAIHAHCIEGARADIANQARRHANPWKTSEVPAPILQGVTAVGVAMESVPRCSAMEWHAISTNLVKTRLVFKKHALRRMPQDNLVIPRPIVWTVIATPEHARINGLTAHHAFQPITRGVKMACAAWILWLRAFVSRAKCVSRENAPRQFETAQSDESPPQYVCWSSTANPDVIPFVISMSRVPSQR